MPPRDYPERPVLNASNLQFYVANVTALAASRNSWWLRSYDRLSPIVTRWCWHYVALYRRYRRRVERRWLDELHAEMDAERNR